jgi:cytoskeletal protein RodZ
MSTKSTAPETKNKKSAVKTGLSTFSKILLSLLLILAIFVVWFIFHAWQVLNTTPETINYASQTSFEILTPNGAPGSNNSTQSPVFIPNPAITATDNSEDISAASAPAVTAVTSGKENTQPRATAETVEVQEIQPLAPIDEPTGTSKDSNPDTPATPEPATKPKRAANSTTSGKPLDNLF